MVDLEKGKRLCHVMDTANEREYSFAVTDWQAWAVTHARDLIDEAVRLREAKTILNRALGICEKERNVALNKIDVLERRLNSPRVWTEADEAAYQAMPKADYLCFFEDDPDPSLDGDSE